MEGGGWFANCCVNHMFLPNLVIVVDISAGADGDGDGDGVLSVYIVFSLWDLLFLTYILHKNI